MTQRYATGIVAHHTRPLGSKSSELAGFNGRSRARMRRGVPESAACSQSLLGLGRRDWRRACSSKAGACAGATIGTAKDRVVLALFGQIKFTQEDVASELELESELETTTIVQRVGDFAECRRTQVRVRVRKLRRVEEVDRLGAKGKIRLRGQRPRAGEAGLEKPQRAA